LRYGLKYYLDEFRLQRVKKNEVIEKYRIHNDKLHVSYNIDLLGDHVACCSEEKDACRMLFGKPLGTRNNRLLGYSAVYSH
jgi:hypothetical protein